MLSLPRGSFDASLVAQALRNGGPPRYSATGTPDWDMGEGLRLEGSLKCGGPK